MFQKVSYRKWNRQTKWFLWTGIIYALVTIGTAVYAYARLDFVRSYKVENITTEQNQK